MPPSSAANPFSPRLSRRLVLGGLAATVVPTTLPSTAVAAATNNQKVGFAPGGGFPWMSDADLDTDLDLMVQGGATWVRLDIQRQSIHTAPGRFNWTNTDRVIDACRQKGLKVLGLVFGSPVWDRPAGTTDKFGPDTDARRQSFADFCTALARRYDESDVGAWEIWNEPNIPIFWQPVPNATDYALTLIAAAAAFRAVRRTQTIITGGTAPALDQPDDDNYPTHSPPAWLTRLYKAGAKSSFDALGHHPYTYPSLPTEGNSSWNAFQQVNVLRSLMVAEGDGHTEIWLTEFGAPTGTAADAVSETRQTKIIVTGFTKAIEQWPFLGVMFNYGLRDAGSNPAEREDNFGLVTADGDFKEVCSSFVKLASLTPAD